MNLAVSVRVLKKNPWRSLLSVLTLSLGIASVAIAYSVVDAVILRPLPFAQSDRIVTVTQRVPMLGSSQAVNTAEEFLAWRKTGLFESAAIIDGDESTLNANGQPERIYGATVTPEFFKVFEVKPILGRGLMPEDVTVQRDRVIVLSNQLWARRFEKDRNIIGKTIILDGKHLVVIGVMPPRFDFPRLSEVASTMTWAPEQSEYWTPLTITPQILD